MMPDTGLPDTDPTKLPDSLALPRVLSLAFEASPTLRASHMRLEAARARLGQAWSAYFPQVQVGLSAGRTFETPSYQTIPGISLFEKRYESYGTSLSATLLIFDGLARTYRRLAARAGADESRAAHEEGRRLLARAAGAAFFGALLSEEQVAIAREDLAFQKKLLEQAEKMLSFGRGSETDVLSYRIRVNTAEARLAGALSSAAVGRIVLAELLGVGKGRLPARVKLKAPGTEDTPSGGLDAEVLLKKALRMRPDLARAFYGFKRAGAQEGAALGAFWPVLSAQLQAGHSRRDNTRFSRHDLSVTGGLSLSWSLFDGGALHAGLRSARADLEAARAELSRLVREIHSQILRGIENIRTAEKKLAFEKENVEMSRKLRDMEERSFAAGVSTRITLDQAQRDHLVARVQYAISRISLDLDRFELSVDVGEFLSKVEKD
jgi:outer membrane protein TolC